MRNYIFRRLLLFSVTALTVFSCGDEDSNTSVVTSFEKYPVTMVGTALTVAESDDVYTLNFKLDDRQINDVHLVVSVGNETSATEGVDFELLTHDVELAAFAGQDGFSIEVEVHEDYEIEDGDEDIYLVISSANPSGFQTFESKVITINDSGLVPEPLAEISITADWSDTNIVDDILGGCDIADIDIYVTDPGINNDFADFAGATGNCPEAFDLDLSTAGNGTYLVIADLWSLNYTDLGDLGPVEIPVALTFERGMSVGDEVETLEIAQTNGIITTDDAEGAPTGFVTFIVLAEIEYLDGAYTIIDQDANETNLRISPQQLKEKMLALREKAGRSK